MRRVMLEHRPASGAASNPGVVEPARLLVEPRHQLDAHEYRTAREPGARRDLDAAVGPVEVGWRNADPGAVRLAPERLHQVLHQSRIFKRVPSEGKGKVRWALGP